MSKLTLVAKIRAKTEKRMLVRAELLKLIPATLAEEGCLNYDLHQDNNDPDLFLFYENWTSRAHWEKHNASAHVQAFRQATEGALMEVTLSEMTMIKE